MISHDHMQVINYYYLKPLQSGIASAKKMENMEWIEHLCKGGESSEAFHEDNVGERRANFLERESAMNSELLTDLIGDLAVTIAWNALTHMTTSRRATAIFVSRDAHANPGCSNIIHIHI